VLKRVGIVAVVLSTAAFVYPALARPSVDMSVDTETVELVQECADGFQTWRVGLQVSVSNTSEETVTLESTGFFAKFTTPGSPQQRQDNVLVLDPGGFVPGAQVAPNARGVYHPVVQVSLPCDTSGATMFATLTLVGRDKTYAAGDVFIDNGTPVPVGPTGIFGIAVILGAVGLLIQRLNRRPRPSYSNHSAS
jgi:hypothetical protein